MMLFDYETLRLIWWFLLGVLLIGFAMMDGFDLGVAMCLPWLGKSDIERRVLINTIAPTWEGNQVWLILGAGAIFAAWPTLYALAFSGFYWAMILLLFALILRPVGFKYRSKLAHATWRKFWDNCLFVGGFFPALLFGVAVGNVLQGVPFHFDQNLRSYYTGSFVGLLNPFALYCGLLSVTMLVMHGAFFLAVKTEKILQSRAKKVAKVSGLLTSVGFLLGGVWLYYRGYGYTVMGTISHEGPSNPLYKEVTQHVGAWFINYQQYPIALFVPALGVFAPWLAIIFSKYSKFALVCSALSIAGVIGTVGVSMFPFILPSSSHPGHSLLVWDSSSSPLTLMLMLGVTVLLLPIVVMYTIWVYRVLRGQITEKIIMNNQHTAY